MASRKFYERLLIVVGMFVVFFVITMICLPMVIQLLHIDKDSRTGMLFMATFQAVVMFIAPSIVTARIVADRPFTFLRLSCAPSWLSVAGVIFGYLIALPALNQIIYWNSNISFPESLSYWGEVFREMEDRANDASALMLDVKSWGALLVNLLVIALVTAFGEELFFRGTLQSASASSGAVYTSIWVVALVFSAMHFQIFGFIPRLLLGAWFGYLLFWTRSIYVPVLAHFINNGVVVICAWLTSNGSTFDFEKFGVTEFGFPLPAFISAVSFVIFLVYFKNFFFSRKGRETEESSHTITA